LSTLTDGNPKFILLATDGEPNCGSAGIGGMNLADDAAAINAVSTARSLGFETFVVGIATLFSPADSSLNMMANAGGRPRNASPAYFPVANTGDLVTVLGTIQAMAAQPCTFGLTNVPANADWRSVQVKANGDSVTIARDVTNGWSTNAGMTSLILNGTACTQLMASTLANLTITYRCL
jgi:hypothetical protein